MIHFPWGIPGALMALGVFLTVGFFTPTSRRRELFALMLGLLLLAVLTSWGRRIPWTRDIDGNFLLTIPALLVFSSLLQRTGIAGFLAVKAVKLTQGRALPLLFLTSLGPFGLSIFLGSGPAMALFLPVTFFLAAELEISAAPFLTSHLMAAGAGSLFSAVGSSSSLILSSGLGITYTQYLFTLWPYALAVLLVSLLLFPLVWGRDFHVANHRKARVLDYDARLVLSDPALLTRTLIILIFVTGLFILSSQFRWGLALPAWLGVSLLLFSSPQKDLFQEVFTEAKLAYLLGFIFLSEVLNLTGATEALGQVWVGLNHTPAGFWLTLVVSALVASLTNPAPLMLAAVPTLKASFAVLGLPPSSWTHAPQALQLWLPLVFGGTLGSGVLWGGIFAAPLARAKHTQVQLTPHTLGTSVLVAGLQLATVGLVFMFLGTGQVRPS